MIFVTAGTNEQPFDRLVTYAASVGGSEELVVQYGSSRVPHGRGTWIDFLAWEAMTELMTRARAVVAHAGIGSILLAHRCGRRPIVVPRRGDLGEAVDSHQEPLAMRLAELGLVLVAEDHDALERALAGSSGELSVAPAVGSGDGLARALRASLETLVGPPASDSPRQPGTLTAT